MRRSQFSSRRDNPQNRWFLAVLAIAVGVAGLFLWFNRSARKASSPSTARKTPQKTRKVATTPRRVLPPPRRVKLERVFGFAGRIRGPLSKSFRKTLGKKRANVLSALVARLLIWQLDLRKDLRRNDAIRFLYQPVDEQSQYQILAMDYKSLKRNRRFRYYRFHATGTRFASYYDAKGREIPSRLRNTPVREYEQITSILKMRPRHKGIDFKAPRGTKIYLPWRGRVLRKNWKTRYNGYCLEIAFLSKRPIRGIFLHMDKIEPGVRVGRTLKEGTLLGTVGNTGRSTAPHLHYQLQNAGGRRIYNPLKTHKLYQRTIPDTDRQRFARLVRELDQRLDTKAKLD
jgi:murein DD-endopeptidase MepM/ murein hydrolase activator NlpD